MLSMNITKRALLLCTTKEEERIRKSTLVRKVNPLEIARSGEELLQPAKFHTSSKPASRKHSHTSKNKGIINTLDTTIKDEELIDVGESSVLINLKNFDTSLPKTSSGIGSRTTSGGSVPGSLKDSMDDIMEVISLKKKKQSKAEAEK